MTIRAEIAKHVQKITLTPRDDPTSLPEHGIYLARGSMDGAGGPVATERHIPFTIRWPLNCGRGSGRVNPTMEGTLIRISERVATLHGLGAPQRMALEGKEGGPIQTQDTEPDLSKLTVPELLELERLHKKMAGDGKTAC